MIMVSQFRARRGERPRRQQTLRFSDPYETLLYLAECELGFGCQIISVDNGHVETRTQLMDDIDTTIFRGPAREMEPLLELIHYYQLTDQEYGDHIMEQVIRDTGGNQRLIAMGGFQFAGRARLNVAMLLACGVQDEEIIRTGAGVRLENLAAAVRLVREGLCSFTEALVLAA